LIGNKSYFQKKKKIHILLKKIHYYYSRVPDWEYEGQAIFRRRRQSPKTARKLPSGLVVTSIALQLMMEQ
jgi:hypothetical protein